MHQRRGERENADTALSASAMDSSEASQSRGHIPLMRLMYCFSVISSTKPNVLAQARGASEPGQTPRCNPALPEANGWAWLS
jgi:hypothetical protein